MEFSSKSYSCFFLLVFVLFTPALSFNKRIIGGEFAAPGQFPFIVSVDIEVDSYKGHLCGGTIINNKWILTASHCLIYPINSTVSDLKPNQITILAGTNLLDAKTDIYGVSNVFQHPGFNMNNFSNDIALIKIDGEIILSDLVRTVEIGEVSENDSSTIIGWGFTDQDNITFPNELRYLEVTALSSQVCDTLAEGAMFNMPRGPAQVCIYRGVNQGPCTGDSGGPMVYNGKLVGVTSYTMNGRCADGFPDVYTRTAFYIDWIQEIIEAN